MMKDIIISRLEENAFNELHHDRHSNKLMFDQAMLNFKNCETEHKERELELIEDIRQTYNPECEIFSVRYSKKVGRMVIQEETE